MKQIMKAIMMIAGIVMVFTLNSCKKVEKGPAGPTGPAGATGPTGETGQIGPEAKTYNATLTYAAGETFKVFSGVTDFDSGDALLFYVSVLSNSFYTPISATIGNVDYVPQFSETTGQVYFNTFATGTFSSPWATDQVVNYKIVHIKSTGLIKHPNVDLNNYEEVKAAYNL